MSPHHNHESMLALSENEINKELADVESELGDLSSQIKNLELPEIEIQQMEGMIESMRQKIKLTTKNSAVKQQISESEEKIFMLKAEKKKIKQEILGLKKNDPEKFDETTNEKIVALNQILMNRKQPREQFSSKTVQESLIQEIEQTLKKAKELSIILNKE